MTKVQTTILVDMEDIIYVKEKKINLSRMVRNILKNHNESEQGNLKVNESRVVDKLSADKVMLMQRLQDMEAENDRLKRKYNTLKEKSYGRILKQGIPYT